MTRLSLLLPALLISLSACGSSAADDMAGDIPEDAATLYVAGGCFWCVEKDFEHLDSVYEAVSGFAGGDKRDATYRDHEGHREVVKVYYDAEATSYAELVHFFLRTIDVTDAGGQFCDRGFAYTTAVHYQSEEERLAAEAALAEAGATLDQDIATALAPFTFFVEAEAYHQDYYVKNPVRYRLYRGNCGRDARVKALWGEEAATR